MSSRHRLSIRLLSLTFLSLVSLSNALQLFIVQKPIYVAQDTNVAWEVDLGKNISFHLYLKSNDQAVFFHLNDVEGGGNSSGTTTIIINANETNGSPGPYHFAAYWSNDPGTPDPNTAESGTSDNFNLSSPLTETTSTLANASSGSTTTSSSLQTTTMNITLTTTRSQVIAAGAKVTSSSQVNSPQTTNFVGNSSMAASGGGVLNGSASQPTVTLSAPTSASASATSTAGAMSINNLSTTAIIGSVTGALVGVILLIIIIVYFLRRYRQRRYDRSAAFYQDMMVRPAENRGVIVYDDDADTIIGQTVEKGYSTSI